MIQISVSEAWLDGGASVTAILNIVILMSLISHGGQEKRGKMCG